MAEPVYKKITELDTLSASLDGNETLPIVKSGKTYRRTWANFFGSGWITSLLGAFSAFKAPDANHADDSDTVGGESTAQLHAAGSLTGALNLAVIPAELTGKNAATATLAATATAIGGSGVKCKVVSGTTPSIQGSGTFVDSGVPISKILFISSSVINSAGSVVSFPAYASEVSGGWEYYTIATSVGGIARIYCDLSSSNSYNILSCALKHTVFYTD